MLFYPGALIDPVAYVPMAQQLATSGYEVQIINAPSDDSHEMAGALGRNLSQFAWYGDQLGDDDATISREQQQAQLSGAILEFLSSL